ARGRDSLRALPARTPLSMAQGDERARAERERSADRSARRHERVVRARTDSARGTQALRRDAGAEGVPRILAVAAPHPHLVPAPPRARLDRSPSHETLEGRLGPLAGTRRVRVTARTQRSARRTITAAMALAERGLDELRRYRVDPHGDHARALHDA